MQRLGRQYPHVGHGPRFKQWLTSERPQPYYSYGNGAAMRVSPCAVSYQKNAEEILSQHPEAWTHTEFGEWVQGYGCQQYAQENERRKEAFAVKLLVNPTEVSRWYFGDLFDQELLDDSCLLHRMMINWQTLKAISRRLPAKKEGMILYYGSGDYHYLTLANLLSVDQAYTLVVLDHHIDAGALLFPELISCGSWLADLMRVSRSLQHVYVLGPESTCQYAHKPLASLDNSRLTCIEETKLQYSHWADLRQLLSGQTVYVSIDGDVLDKDDLATNWDQGHVRLTQLCDMLQTILTPHQLLGADMCGAKHWTMSQALSTQGQREIKLERRYLQRCFATLMTRF